jgi:hypothetical protein
MKRSGVSLHRPYRVILIAVFHRKPVDEEVEGAGYQGLTTDTTSLFTFQLNFSVLGVSSRVD